MMCLNMSVALGILPVARFLGGHTGFLQHMHRAQRVQPLMIHTTFTCECRRRGAVPRAPFPSLASLALGWDRGRSGALVHALGSLRDGTRGSGPAQVARSTHHARWNAPALADAIAAARKHGPPNPRPAPWRVCAADADDVGKRNRMREAMLFDDPPAYWSGEERRAARRRQVPRAHTACPRCAPAAWQVFFRDRVGPAWAPQSRAERWALSVVPAAARADDLYVAIGIPHAPSMTAPQFAQYNLSQASGALVQQRACLRSRLASTSRRQGGAG